MTNTIEGTDSLKLTNSTFEYTLTVNENDPYNLIQTSSEYNFNNISSQLDANYHLLQSPDSTLTTVSANNTIVTDQTPRTGVVILGIQNTAPDEIFTQRSLELIKILSNTRVDFVEFSGGYTKDSKGNTTISEADKLFNEFVNLMGDNLKFKGLKFINISREIVECEIYDLVYENEQPKEIIISRNNKALSTEENFKNTYGLSQSLRANVIIAISGDTRPSKERALYWLQKLYQSSNILYPMILEVTPVKNKLSFSDTLQNEGFIQAISSTKFFETFLLILSKLGLGNSLKSIASKLRS